VPVDPAFAPILESIASMPPPPPGSDPVAAARAGTDAMFVHPSPPEVDVVDRTIPGPGGDIPVRVYTPVDAATPTGVLVYFHGGGFVAGSIASHDGTVRELAAQAGCIAVSVDYRLAPEHPYPAAIDDCVAAYRALVTTNGPETIAIAGDSAGGGATLATLVRLRDEGIPLPACAYVISPWTDLTASGASVTSRAASDPMIDAAAIVDTARRYAGAAPLDDPGVSPLFADLTGLPPLLVHVGDDEVLLDDSIRLAERARAAGVEVELEVYHGLWHVFHAFAGLVPEATSALRAGSAFIARHAGRPPA
jgi:monoterpene epsilon-lactone hydrolase